MPFTTVIAARCAMALAMTRRELAGKPDWIAPTVRSTCTRRPVRRAHASSRAIAADRRASPARSFSDRSSTSMSSRVTP